MVSGTSEYSSGFPKVLSELSSCLLAMLTLLPSVYCFVSLATKSFSEMIGMKRKPLASQAFIPVAHNPEGGVAVLESSAEPLGQLLSEAPWTTISKACLTGA